MISGSRVRRGKSKLEEGLTRAGQSDEPGCRKLLQTLSMRASDDGPPLAKGKKNEDEHGGYGKKRGRADDPVSRRAKSVREIILKESFYRVDRNRC